MRVVRWIGTLVLIVGSWVVLVWGCLLALHGLIWLMSLGVGAVAS